jgi:SAM-dependent methyltransferase
MPTHIFIDRDVHVYEGDEAAAKVAAHNDLRFWEDGRGVTRVDRERWIEAQAYERRTWMNLNRAVLDDRNRTHLARFFGYRTLAGRHFHRAIELGCGPFTNLRLILEVATAEHVHLLDPLVKVYCDHPLCRYRNGRLGGIGARIGFDALRALRNPRLAVAELATALRIGGARGRRVELEPSSIEDFQTPHRFDLVVMINVIEHCRDVDAVLRKIDEILAPGGTFVFHEAFMSTKELRSTVEDVFDAGHPLRVQRNVVDAFLDGTFDVEFRSEFRDVEDHAGRTFDTTSLFYIGRRRASAAPAAR